MLMKKYLLPLLALCLLQSCAQYRLTQTEKDAIYSGSDTVPMRILTIADRQDSLLLRQKSLPVDIKNDLPSLQHLVSRMRATLDKIGGVGIAAVQVGIARNIFLFTQVGEEGKPLVVAVNPVITNRSAETFCFFDDGCLSVPSPRYGNSVRRTWIEVKYFDLDGKVHTARLNGGMRMDDYTGIIFQHEYDHLQGVLFIDKLCPE
jgi:peptide deformylase